jgi:hypothetical protein
LVGVGRKNGFVWYFLVFGATVGRRLDGRELHVGSIVERGKGVVGGRAFVFNEKWRNVEVTGKGGGAGTRWKHRLPNQDQPLMVADGVGELMDEEAKRGALPTSRSEIIG